ncbi:hypothetical protein [Paraburkholderia elongata]|uniref:MFS transporter n=1 Tax=Paraburkholderia elongata TaxID=2675747 RepID=A0A972NMJ9_9BURK|nr:hypothetical protein [Paraburkholderia elongata]NPT55299.1 hypothetical protein [Paraburkholderia elongata]
MAAASADPTTRGARAAACVANAAYVRPAVVRVTRTACVLLAIAAGAARMLIARVGGAASGRIASVGGAARGLMASVVSTACVLLVSGAATLVTQADLGQRANSLWMSALALATMTIVPLLMSRISRQHTTLATAVTLIATMSAMGVVPAYVGGLEHRTAIAALAMVIGGVLLLYGRHLAGTTASPPEHSDRNKYSNQNANQSTRAMHATDATALLALLAGLSSGSLARFQLYAICGMSGVQPISQIALSVSAVCALALIADRSGNNNRMLAVLYVLRAVLIGALAAVDSPTLALFAAKMFVVLDCLTIPALVKLRGKSRSAMRAGCPGAVHHLGMVSGATLSTTPYFFGDGFMMLYALSSMASLICAVSLATGWFEKKPFRKHSNHHHRQAGHSDEHEVQGGKYDSFVTHC